MKLHRDENVGGNGFHESLNFQIPEDSNVAIYLPPTSLPREELLNDEFVIFSFTYKGDRELPARIVGVHANVRILDKCGIPHPVLGALVPATLELLKSEALSSSLPGETVDEVQLFVISNVLEGPDYIRTMEDVVGPMH